MTNLLVFFALPELQEEKSWWRQTLTEILGTHLKLLSHLHFILLNLHCTKHMFCVYCWYALARHPKVKNLTRKRRQENPVCEGNSDKLTSLKILNEVNILFLQDSSRSHRYRITAFHFFFFRLTMISWHFCEFGISQEVNDSGDSGWNVARHVVCNRVSQQGKALVGWCASITASWGRYQPHEEKQRAGAVPPEQRKSCRLLNKSSISSKWTTNNSTTAWASKSDVNLSHPE